MRCSTLNGTANGRWLAFPDLSTSLARAGRVFTRGERCYGGCKVTEALPELGQAITNETPRHLPCRSIPRLEENGDPTLFALGFSSDMLNRAIRPKSRTSSDCRCVFVFCKTDFI